MRSREKSAFKFDSFIEVTQYNGLQSRETLTRKNIWTCKKTNGIEKQRWEEPSIISKQNNSLLGLIDALLLLKYQKLGLRLVVLSGILEVTKKLGVNLKRETSN